MTADSALPTRSISRAALLGAITGIWAAANGLVFLLAWCLRKLSLPIGYGWFWLVIWLFGFTLFYWAASARWPSSSHVSRFGFALGAGAVNCVVTMYTAFIIGELIFAQ